MGDALQQSSILTDYADFSSDTHQCVKCPNGTDSDLPYLIIRRYCKVAVYNQGGGLNNPVDMQNESKRGKKGSLVQRSAQDRWTGE